MRYIVSRVLTLDSFTPIKYEKIMRGSKKFDSTKFVSKYSNFRCALLKLDTKKVVLETFFMKIK